MYRDAGVFDSQCWCAAVIWRGDCNEWSEYSDRPFGFCVYPEKSESDEFSNENTFDYAYWQGRLSKE